MDVVGHGLPAFTAAGAIEPPRPWAAAGAPDAGESGFAQVANGRVISTGTTHASYCSGVT